MLLAFACHALQGLPECSILFQEVLIVVQVVLPGFLIMYYGIILLEALSCPTVGSPRLIRELLVNQGC
jgi:hypothetical protein